MVKQTQVTKVGLESLKTELNELVNVKRPKAVDRLSNARSHGDLTENSDYQNARDELEFIDGQISELEDVLKSVVIVETNGHAKDQVGVGTKVTVKTKGKTHTFNIVGEWEADPSEKRISHTSPLGKALVGKGVGDSVEVEAPAGRILYEIVQID